MWERGLFASRRATCRRAQMSVKQKRGYGKRFVCRMPRLLARPHVAQPGHPCSGCCTRAVRAACRARVLQGCRGRSAVGSGRPSHATSTPPRTRHALTPGLLPNPAWLRTFGLVSSAGGRLTANASVSLLEMEALRTHEGKATDATDAHPSTHIGDFDLLDEV